MATAMFEMNFPKHWPILTPELYNLVTMYFDNDLLSGHHQAINPCTHGLYK